MVSRIASWTHGVYTDAFCTKITSLQVFIIITRVETALTDSFQYQSYKLKLLFNGSRKRLLSERCSENELNFLEDLLMQEFSTALKRVSLELNVYYQDFLTVELISIWDKIGLTGLDLSIS